MKKILSLIAIPILLASCNIKNNTPISGDVFGVFLGAKSSRLSTLIKYDNVAIELEEFSSKDIEKLHDNDTNIYAYLSVGSLESYRSYYDEFKEYTFYDYDNWDDERWIDVSVKSWQDHIVSTAKELYELGADGLFLDNLDVYYIAIEEYKGSSSFVEGIYNGLHSIIEELSKLDLYLLINSGTMFLERLKDNNDSLINSFEWYAQESVFSTIIDYDKNIFGRQDEEEHQYCLEMIEMMKTYSNILMIEYTKDENLIEEIKEYANNNDIYYFISNNVNLE